MSEHVAAFYIMRRANIVYATAETREHAELLLAAARREHPRDRVRIIETLNV